MHLFDESALNRIGLWDLSPARREKLCERMDHVLKLRVGEALLDAISDDDLTAPYPRKPPSGHPHPGPIGSCPPFQAESGRSRPS
jgi:hypothetical protein